MSLLGPWVRQQARVCSHICLSRLPLATMQAAYSSEQTDMLERFYFEGTLDSNQVAFVLASPSPLSLYSALHHAWIRSRPCTGPRACAARPRSVEHGRYWRDAQGWLEAKEARGSSTACSSSNTQHTPTPPYSRGSSDHLAPMHAPFFVWLLMHRGQCSPQVLGPGGHPLVASPPFALPSCAALARSRALG